MAADSGPTEVAADTTAVSSSSILEKCCLIGEAVAGNPTHFMIERAFADADLDWRFLTFEIEAKRLGEALRGVDALGLHGALLIGPLREAVADCFKNLTERAQRTGSVTCLVRDGVDLVADDLIGAAAADAIEQHTPLAGKDALLLGAARVAHSLADAIVGRGVASLAVADRHLESAERLAEALKRDHPEIAITCLPWEDDALDTPDELDVVVSSACWPKQRDGRAAEAVGEALHRGVIVADARVSTARTPLLRAAAEHDATIIDGVEVLARETAMAVHQWTGVLVDRAALQEAAEEFLGV